MKRFTAPLFACALALAACAPDFDSLGEGDSGSVYTPVRQQEKYVDVDPDIFSNEYGAQVAGASGLLGCTLKDPNLHRQALVVCESRFRYPLPPIEFDGGVPDPLSANVVLFNYDTGKFETGQSPGSQGFVTPPPALEPGERVTLWGTTLTHLIDGGFRVERDGDAFEVHDYVYQPDWDSANRRHQASLPVPLGTICGTVYTAAGSEQLVVANQDGTTCDHAMDAMDGYRMALWEGETEGQAALWTSPTGWGCTGRYFFEGEEYVGANGKLSCNASGLTGNETPTAGAGGVTAVDKDEIHLLP